MPPLQHHRRGLLPESRAGGHGPAEDPALLDAEVGQDVVVVGAERRLAVAHQQHDPHVLSSSPVTRLQAATVVTTRARDTGSTHVSRACSIRTSDQVTNGSATTTDICQVSTMARPEKIRLVSVVVTASLVE